MPASRYAKAKVDGRTVSAHRKVWEDAHGPIPDGYLVHHINEDRFDNRLENLQLMTHAEHSRHHNQKHPLTTVCVVCGATFTPLPTKRGRTQTCGRECMRALMASKARIRETRRRLTGPRTALGRSHRPGVDPPLPEPRRPRQDPGGGRDVTPPAYRRSGATYKEVAEVVADLPAAIRNQRRRKGLSLREAAEQSGVSFTTLARWESDVNHLDNLLAVLRWLQS